MGLTRRGFREGLAHGLVTIIQGPCGGLSLDGHKDLARRAARTCLHAIEWLVGDEDPILIRPLDQASFLFASGEAEEDALAERVYRIAVRCNAGGQLSVDYMGATLASRQVHKKRWERAEEICRERIVAQGESPIGRNWRWLLSQVREGQQRPHEAEAELRAVVLAAPGPEKFGFELQLARLLERTKQYQEARALYQQLLDQRVREKADDATLQSFRHTLNVLDDRLGKHAALEPYWRKQRDPSGLAHNLHRQKKYVEAEALYRQLLAKADGPQPKPSPPDEQSKWLAPMLEFTARMRPYSELTDLAAVLEDQGKHAEAEPMRARALAVLEQANGPTSNGVAWPLEALARVRLALGRPADAEPLVVRALAIRQATSKPAEIAACKASLEQIRQAGR